MNVEEPSATTTDACGLQDAEDATASCLKILYFPLGRDRAAFTLIELLAVIAVIATLMALAIPNLSSLANKFQEVRCTSHMKAITQGLYNYLEDNKNIWPQGPPPNAGLPWENFWLGALQPYGIDPATWRCPGIPVRDTADSPRVHYTPTLFPPVPGIAKRWTSHPWLIERGDGHGQGSLIAYPDGSVKSYHKVLAELGAR